MRQQADEDVIHDKKEAIVYSRCHVREEQEEQQKREEWFGASPQDLRNLLSESTIDRRDSNTGVKTVDTMVRMQLESFPTFFPIIIILVSVGQLIPFSMITYLGEFSPIGFGAEIKTGLFSSPELPFHVKNYSHLVPKHM